MITDSHLEVIQTPMCLQPIEVLEDGESRLGCVTESWVSQCSENATSGDFIERLEFGCKISKRAMQARFRLITDLGLELNLASAEDLQLIKGIGPQIAKRIVEYRTRHGRFQNVKELKQVHGIGPKLLNRLEKVITLEGLIAERH